MIWRSVEADATLNSAPHKKMNHFGAENMRLCLGQKKNLFRKYVKDGCTLKVVIKKYERVEIFSGRTQ